MARVIDAEGYKSCRVRGGREWPLMMAVFGVGRDGIRRVFWRREGWSGSDRSGVSRWCCETSVVGRAACLVPFSFLFLLFFFQNK